MAATKDKRPTHNILSLHKRVKELEEIVAKMLNPTIEPHKEPGINKVETFNGAETPKAKDGMKMNEEHKMQSMENAIKVLPPNFINNGRHSKENIQAICGFNVSPEMMNSLYAQFKHTAEGVVPVK